MIDLTRCRLGLDEPKPLYARSGRLRLKGWCFDEEHAGPLHLRLCVAGRYHQFQTGLERADLAAAFPQFPQARSAGFLLELWIPIGCHPATLEVSADGKHWMHARQLTLCAEAAPLQGVLDETIQTEGDSSGATLSGWVLHPQDEIAHLELQLAGRTETCHFGQHRAEKRPEFDEMPHGAHCGFTCRISLPAAPAVPRLRARLRSGQLLVLPFEKPLVSSDPHVVEFIAALDEERAGLLSIPASARPRVSIVIAVFNQLGLTLNCLRSIVEHTAAGSYEIIVVDDCSAEPTRCALEKIAGLHLLRNEANRGFLESCNRAAAVARGDYLLFLNNDVEVGPEWIEAMMRVFAERSDAGLVGAKLVYPDGTLQEAGAIIWRDGTGANYGRGGSPSRPEYNYLREVDYCSGACLLTPRALFEELDGFDPQLAPAYYEDTDLAMKVRAAGRKVYYQPAAVVVHHEGATSGRSLESGAKRYQAINRLKFCAKWEKALASHPGPGEVALDLAKDRGVTRRLLVVDARIPQPDHDSGSMRMVNLLRIFLDLGFKVTFLPDNCFRAMPYTARIQAMGIECLYGPFVRDPGDFVRDHAAEFDLILLSRLEVAGKMLPIIHEASPETPTVFDTVDLHFLRGEREAHLADSGQKRETARQTRRVELELAEAADAVVVVSPTEKEILAEAAPSASVAIVSNIHETRPTTTPYAERSGFAFIGGFEHPPNVDAMLWFCREIMPAIVARISDVHLHIIGSRMPDSVRALASPEVTVHGFVEDLGPFFESCLLTIAPLRYGAGVKGKINQSMSHGVPVVTTSIGAEGMYLRHEHDVLVADNPDAFAREVVRLHEDPALWQRLSEGGLANIEKYFSFAAARANVVELLAQLKVAYEIRP